MWRTATRQRISPGSAQMAVCSISRLIACFGMPVSQSLLNVGLSFNGPVVFVAAARPGNARWHNRSRLRDRPAARSSERLDANTSLPSVVRRASPLFSEQILQRGIVEHGLRQHPFQPAVLILQRLQSPRFRDPPALQTSSSICRSSLSCRRVCDRPPLSEPQPPAPAAPQ